MADEYNEVAVWATFVFIIITFFLFGLSILFIFIYMLKSNFDNPLKWMLIFTVISSIITLILLWIFYDQMPYSYTEDKGCNQRSWPCNPETNDKCYPTLQACEEIHGIYVFKDTECVMLDPNDKTKNQTTYDGLDACKADNYGYEFVEGIGCMRNDVCQDTIRNTRECFDTLQECPDMRMTHVFDGENCIPQECTTNNNSTCMTDDCFISKDECEDSCYSNKRKRIRSKEISNTHVYVIHIPTQTQLSAVNSIYRKAGHKVRMESITAKSKASQWLFLDNEGYPIDLDEKLSNHQSISVRLMSYKDTDKCLDNADPNTVSDCERNTFTITRLEDNIVTIKSEDMYLAVDKNELGFSEEEFMWQISYV
jgi:hypothetical protein